MRWRVGLWLVVALIWTVGWWVNHPTHEPVICTVSHPVMIPEIRNSEDWDAFVKDLKQLGYCEALK